MPRCRVLLIDDDPCMQDLVDAVLSSHGYDVDVAPDGASGLHAAGHRRPDVVLLDIGLPDAYGLDVLHRLRAVRTMTGVPIVVMSGCAAEAYGARALAAGAVCYVEKPAPVARLLETVRRVCDHARA